MRLADHRFLAPVAGTFKTPGLLLSTQDMHSNSNSNSTVGLQGFQGAQAPPLLFRRWTPQEDEVLLSHAERHGTRQWSLLQRSGRLPDRDNKACCNRYRILRKQRGLRDPRDPQDPKDPEDPSGEACSPTSSDGNGTAAGEQGEGELLLLKKENVFAGSDIMNVAGSDVMGSQKQLPCGLASGASAGSMSDGNGWGGGLMPSLSGDSILPLASWQGGREALGTAGERTEAWLGLSPQAPAPAPAPTPAPAPAPEPAAAALSPALAAEQNLFTWGPNQMPWQGGGPAAKQKLPGLPVRSMSLKEPFFAHSSLKNPALPGSHFFFGDPKGGGLPGQQSGNAVQSVSAEYRAMLAQSNRNAAFLSLQQTHLGLGGQPNQGINHLGLGRQHNNLGLGAGGQTMELTGRVGGAMWGPQESSSPGHFGVPNHQKFPSPGASVVPFPEMGMHAALGGTPGAWAGPTGGLGHALGIRRCQSSLSSMEHQSLVASGDQWPLNKEHMQQWSLNKGHMHLALMQSHANAQAFSALMAQESMGSSQTLLPTTGVMPLHPREHHAASSGLGCLQGQSSLAATSAPGGRSGLEQYGQFLTVAALDSSSMMALSSQSSNDKRVSPKRTETDLQLELPRDDADPVGISKGTSGSLGGQDYHSVGVSRGMSGSLGGHDQPFRLWWNQGSWSKEAGANDSALRMKTEEEQDASTFVLGRGGGEGELLPLQGQQLQGEGQHFLKSPSGHDAAGQEVEPPSLQHHLRTQLEALHAVDQVDQVHQVDLVEPSPPRVPISMLSGPWESQGSMGEGAAQDSKRRRMDFV